ncbi:metal-sulfur cluster assembly factor [Candidatus Woesearchaeota archaeon]|nr:metal-sulfur cluster assembly factor [Candidatus Woesearchaeota archaeon]
MEKQIINALKTCYDPELNIDVWTLGLIYSVKHSGGTAHIKMTFTTPFCPYAETLLQEIENKVKSIKGIRKVSIDVVFSPPWQPSDELKAMLGLI